MKLFFILGNQLFPLKYIDRFKKDHLFFMAEDNGLCTYEKHHKQKILLFLSSMRSYADSLKKNKYKLNYLKIEDKDDQNRIMTPYEAIDNGASKLVIGRSISKAIDPNKTLIEICNSINFG